MENMDYLKIECSGVLINNDYIICNRVAIRGSECYTYYGLDVTTHRLNTKSRLIIYPKLKKQLSNMDGMFPDGYFLKYTVDGYELTTEFTYIFVISIISTSSMVLFISRHEMSAFAVSTDVRHAIERSTDFLLSFTLSLAGLRPVSEVEIT